MNIIATDPRDDFEKVFPLPKHVIRCGNGYACTEYNAWGAYEFIHKWEGWRAAKLGDGTLINEGTTAAPAVQAEQLSGNTEQVSQTYTLTFDQWLSRQTGKIDVDCGCVTTEAFIHWLRLAYEDGNYPVIPDGYALVPIEPTDLMVEAMYRHPLSMRGALKAAIEAAPKQEAE
ncbi:hypothetical protein [Atlantibacter hermannii]|uniref:hypothetical protein n=1 Tax=Atlantibacter hermannii TaxID=565 RepID=UPI003A8F1855